MCIYKCDFKISNSIKGEDQLKIDPKPSRKNVLVTGYAIGPAGTVLKKKLSSNIRDLRCSARCFSS